MEDKRKLYEETITKICLEKNYTFLGFCDETRFNEHSLILLKCNVCGNEWKCEYCKFKNGSGCRICKNKEKILSLDTVLANITKRCKEDDIVFNGFVGESYENKNTKLKLKCSKCGCEWETTSYISFINGSGCKNCAKAKRTEKTKLSYETAMKVINEKCIEHNLTFLGFVEGKYVNAKAYLNVKCNVCGNEWKISYDNLKHDYSCPICKINKSRNSKEKINENINKCCKEQECEFLGFVGGEYVNTFSKLILKCKRCGKVWDTTDYKGFIFSKVGCSCKKTSKMEREIHNLLKSNGIEFEEQKRFNWLGKQSLDFYIPSKNIAIECQGMQHFKPIDYGSENRDKFSKFERQKKLDDIKMQLCVNNGIKLLHYSDLTVYFPYDVITSKNVLIEKLS